jgi:hypothetical protein
LHSKDCTIKSHAESKVEVCGATDRLVFITQIEACTVFVEPSVRESQVPPELWLEWTNRALPLKGWNREFEAVYGSDDKLATFEDIKKETRFLDSADEFRTPAKRKRDIDGDNPLLVGI